MAAKPAQKPSVIVPAASTTKPAAHPQEPQSIADATQAATAAVAAAMAKLAPNGTRQQPQNMADNLTQQVNQMRINDGQYSGRGRGRGVPRGGRRDAPSQPIDVPKEDYDFEGANKKFNKQDLVKEAIASGSPLTSPPSGVLADPFTGNVPTNGHTNGDSEDVVIPPKSSTEKGYDKKSSFFDNISSDLRDRFDQQSSDQMIDGRAIRREERTKNIDTFGQGSVDTGYRGGFRGRGRGRGSGRGRGYGGPGRGGFDEERSGFRGRGRGGAESAAV